MDRGRRPAIARRRRTTWRLRAEAHVVRLAALYATLDCDDQIALPHLEATLAVWRYSADSARWIFGDSLAEPHLFRRNKRAHEIDRAVAVLEEAGRLHRVSISISDGRGRPAETWFPAGNCEEA